MLDKNFFKTYSHPMYGNVSVGYQPSAQGAMLEYASRYQIAAGILVKSMARNTGKHDYDGCVIIFLYRHMIELYLKAIISVGKDIFGLKEKSLEVSKKVLDGHILIKLLPIVKEIITEENSFPAIENNGITWEILEVFIKELHEIDKDSQAFRYPTNKNGNSTRKKSFVLNIVEFAKTAENIGNYFYDCGGYLRYTRDNAIENFLEIKK